MLRLIVVLVALAGISASADKVDVTFPELARERSGASRIVSGYPAEIGQIPHQLSLRLVDANGIVIACGGSIIHHEWAMTAAHCTANRVSIVIRAGTVNLTLPALFFESTEYYNNPLYNENMAGTVQPNDISIIKFNQFVEFTDLIKPVRIQRHADRDANYMGAQLTASGWGLTWTEGSSPENLRWVNLRGMANLICQLYYDFSPIIQPSTICADGWYESSQSVCQGDSGGPLTVVEKDNEITLVGVTSFVSGLGCHEDIPSGFIRPGYYHAWLKDVTGIDFDWDFQ